MTPEAIREKRLKKLSFVAPKYSNFYIKAWAKKTSALGAIKAFCLECCGDDRVAIRDCTAPACPLWEYRPYGGEHDPQYLGPQRILKQMSPERAETLSRSLIKARALRFVRERPTTENTTTGA